MESVMEIWKTAANADGKPIHGLWKLQAGFPQQRRAWQFTHIPTTPCGQYPSLLLRTNMESSSLSGGSISCLEHDLTVYEAQITVGFWLLQAIGA